MRRIEDHRRRKSPAILLKRQIHIPVRKQQSEAYRDQQRESAEQPEIGLWTHECAGRCWHVSILRRLLPGINWSTPKKRQILLAVAPAAEKVGDKRCAPFGFYPLWRPVIPDNSLVPRNLENAPASRFRHQKTAVGQWIGRGAHRAEQGIACIAAIFPENLAVRGIDIQDTGKTARLAEIAQVIEHGQRPVRQEFGIVLMLPRAIGRPDYALFREIGDRQKIEIA